MEIEKLAEIILEKYRNGQRHFSNYVLENENFEDQNLADFLKVFYFINFQKDKSKQC